MGTSWFQYLLWLQVAPSLRAGEFSEAAFFASHAEASDWKALAERALRGRELLRQGKISHAKELLQRIPPAKPFSRRLAVFPVRSVLAAERNSLSSARDVLDKLAQGRLGSALSLGLKAAASAKDEAASRLLRPSSFAAALFEHGISVNRDPIPLAQRVQAVWNLLLRGGDVLDTDLDALFKALPTRQSTSPSLSVLLMSGMSAELAADGDGRLQVLSAIAGGDYRKAVRLSAEFLERERKGPAAIEHRQALLLVYLDSMDPKTFPQPVVPAEDLRVPFLPVLMASLQVESSEGGPEHSRLLPLIREGRWVEAIHGANRLLPRGGGDERFPQAWPSFAAARLFEFGLVKGKEPDPLAALCVKLQGGILEGSRLRIAELEAQFRALAERRLISKNFAKLLIYAIEAEMSATSGHGMETIEAVSQGAFERAIRAGQRFAHLAKMRPSVLDEFRLAMDAFEAGKMNLLEY